jgi:hypothetical protein
MAQIYAAPKVVGPVPQFDHTKPYNEYENARTAYIKKVEAWAKENGSGEFAGKQIHFQVGDGYAQYVVVSLQPVKLIHLAIGDAWHFEYAKRLTAKDVRTEVKRMAALGKLFTRKSA